MTERNLHCALIAVADGFDELDVVGVVSTLREAGLLTKVVGVTSGLVQGRHGVPMLPDTTLVDFTQVLERAILTVLVLPGDSHHVRRLGHDPRVHDLIRRVIDGGGLVALRRHTLTIVKDAMGCEGFLEHREQIMMWDPLDQSLAAFVLDLLGRLEPMLLA